MQVFNFQNKIWFTISLENLDVDLQLPSFSFCFKSLPGVREYHLGQKEQEVGEQSLNGTTSFELNL